LSTFCPFHTGHFNFGRRGHYYFGLTQFSENNVSPKLKCHLDWQSKNVPIVGDILFG
jgi:hypothetical protein